MSDFKFNQAKKYKLPFGKFKGREIDDIATTDNGLKYLDWLYGEVGTGVVKNMLKIYLENETIAKQLKEIIF
jgi:uncharacterized protein (DUF3820 family)